MGSRNAHTTIGQTFVCLCNQLDAIYKQAMGWVVGLVIFGLIVSGINNWAHGGGLLSGLFLAFIMGYNDRKRENATMKLSAYGCVLLTIFVLIWAAANSFFSF